MAAMEPVSVRGPDGVGEGSAAPLAKGRLWLLALLTGLGAGLISWGGAELAAKRLAAVYEDIPAKFRGNQGTATPYLKRLTERAQANRGAAGYGLLGGLLGLGLGAAGGLARGSTRGALTAAVVGGVLGAGAGVGASYGLVPGYFRMIDRVSEAEAANDLTGGLMFRVGILSALGLASGLALGLGAGGTGRMVAAAVGGVMGAILAAVACEVIGVMAFPGIKTGMPVGDLASLRAAAHLLTGLAVAIGAALGADRFVVTQRAKAPIAAATA